MNIGSALSSVASSYENTNSPAGSQPASSADSSSVDFDNMTISQIRDMTDKMAQEGKLTGLEQLALIGDGLQDPDANSPSYQPNDGVGYSRSDPSTYNFVAMMNGAADFADSMNNAQSASTYSRIADTALNYENSVSGASINTTA